MYIFLKKPLATSVTMGCKGIRMKAGWLVTFISSGERWPRMARTGDGNLGCSSRHSPCEFGHCQGHLSCCNTGGMLLRVRYRHV